MLVSDFHFYLPEELIAQHPPAERGASRMLVFSKERGPASTERAAPHEEKGGCAGDLAGWFLHDTHFRQLPDFLRPGDLLVLNDSRVIPARLFARRAIAPTAPHPDSHHPKNPTGAIEVLLTEKFPAADTWHALVKPGRKVRAGDRLEFFAGDSAHHQPLLSADVIAASERGERTLRFAPVPDFNAVLARIGHMPLPPYIRRGQDAPEDRDRYQTVYARNLAPDEPGSAAAPTAGLHFTPQVLDALRARGVQIAYLTLHVGLGTFQPVRVGRVEDIRLHAEQYTLPPQTADALRRALHDRRRIVAAGTTTTRTLEHIAHEALSPVSESRPLDRSGHQTSLTSGIFPPRQGAGAAADFSDPTTSAKPATDRWIDRIAPHSGSTSIFIAPGQRFRIVSGLLTNFHLPQSTLLMLVSAFAADRMGRSSDQAAAHEHAETDLGRRAILAAYAHAIGEGYRFFSYGDCMLVV